MDKYKQYIDVQWWSGIEKRDLENWIRNFGTSEKLAELILDSVIFYNAAQLKAYTRFLINNLKGQVYAETVKENGYSYIEDAVLDNKWNKYLNVTNFIPAALQSDPTSSAHKILGYWRSILGRGNHLFSSIGDIEKNYKNGIRRFVLVDDFSGSGKQMLEVLKQKIEFNGSKIELGLLPNIIEDIEIVISVYVIHEEAKRTLTNEYSKIRITYVDLISDDLNYLNEKALIYEKIDIDKRQELIRELQKFTDSVVKNNEEFQKLSSYILNIPIVFEHGCPNNTLLLLFAHSDNWQQLFKRGEEI